MMAMLRIGRADMGTELARKIKGVILPSHAAPQYRMHGKKALR